jgi:hypothetical protein
MPRAVLVLVLLAGVLGGVWLLAGGGPEAPEVAPVALTPDRVPVAQGPGPLVPEVDLEAPRAAQDSAADAGGLALPHPLEVELTLLAPAGLEVPADWPAPGSGANARFSGVISGPDARGIQARLEFEHGTNAPRVIETDSAGRFGANDLWPGVAVVRIETSTGLVARREVLLRSLAEARLGLSFAAPAVVLGRVEDLFGKPIASAEVEIDGNRAFSDVDGNFSIRKVAPGLRIVGTARAKGYAAQRELLSLERGSVVEEGRLTFRLPVGTTLDVVVPRAVGAREPVQVLVFAASGSGAAAAGQSRFPWEWLSPLAVPPGGRLHLEDLPPETITLVPFHSGAVAVPSQQNCKLDEGRDNQATIQLEPGAVVRGRLLFDGAPVAGARVRLEAPDRSNATTRALGRRPMYHQEAIFPHVHAAKQEVVTPSSGKFVLSAYPQAGDRWYLEAESADGRLVARALVEAGAEGVELGDLELQPRGPSEANGVLRLDLAPRLWAVDLDVRVQGAPRDRARLRPGATHDIGGLTPGLWRVDARYREQRLASGRQATVGEVDLGSDPAEVLVLPVPPEATVAPTSEQLGLGRTGPPPLDGSR